MGTEFLINTSAAIKFLNKTLPSNGITRINGFINTGCTLSFITEIELQVWSPTNPDDIAAYKNFVAHAQIIRVTSAIISETIKVRKNYRLKIADAIIAATALAFNCTSLLTTILISKRFLPRNTSIHGLCNRICMSNHACLVLVRHVFFYAHQHFCNSVHLTNERRLQAFCSDKADCFCYHP